MQGHTSKLKKAQEQDWDGALLWQKYLSTTFT